MTICATCSLIPVQIWRLECSSFGLSRFPPYSPLIILSKIRHVHCHYFWISSCPLNDCQVLELVNCASFILLFCFRQEHEMSHRREICTVSRFLGPDMEQGVSVTICHSGQRCQQTPILVLAFLAIVTPNDHIHGVLKHFLYGLHKSQYNIYCRLSRNSLVPHHCNHLSQQRFLVIPVVNVSWKTTSLFVNTQVLTPSIHCNMITFCTSANM